MALGSAVEGQIQRAATELPGAVLRQLFALAVEQLSYPSPTSPALPALDSASSVGKKLMSFVISSLTFIQTLVDQSVVLKEAYAAISHVSYTTSRRLVEELGVVENAVDDIAGLLHTSVPNIRALGGVSGLELNEVVGVSWQLDHCIRSSTYGNIREQLYLIVLTTKSPRTGVVATVEFTCTVAQLEELVYKLQEATHQIDKAIASFADPLSERANMSAPQLDQELFFRRLNNIYASWRDPKNAEWDDVESFLVLAGKPNPDDSGYRKSAVLQFYLLGFLEFPETLMVFTKSKLLVLTSGKKYTMLEAILGGNDTSDVKLELLKRDKTDGNKANYAALIAAIEADSVKKRVGVLAKESPDGDFVQLFQKEVDAAGMDKIDISKGIECALRVKAPEELENIRWAGALTKKVFQSK
ncbi:hypothetical protein DYB31_011747, partial [Aphanomyces astaci]